MSDIGFGIIGQGVGHGHTKRTVMTEGARLAAVCDLREDLRDRAASEFGVPVYEDYRKMLERDDVDVVCIYTWAGARREIALDAFDAGKDVICTKPMEINIERCDDMIRAAKEKGRKLVIDFGMRYAPTMLGLKKAVDDGMFGKLLMSKAELRWFRNQEYYDWNDGWRGTWRLDGGGSLANQTVHYIDQVQWFMGPPKSVFAYTGVFKWDIEAEDQGVAVIRWANGAIGLISGSTTSVPYVEMNRIEILGTNGIVRTESNSGGYEEGAKRTAEAIEAWDFVDSDGIAKTIEPLRVEGLPRNVEEDMVSVLTKGSEPLVDGIEGRKSVEILNGIYESSQTGQEVAFPLRRPFVPRGGYTR